MAFTDNFNKVKKKFDRLYPTNKAKAMTFAFEEAFELKIPTFRNRESRFKRII